MRILALSVIGGGALALAACGVTGNLRLHPGYAPLGSPGAGDTDRSFALSLGPLPLAFARVVVAGDPEISGILKSLKAVRVYTYEVDGDPARVAARMAATRDRLVERGWQSVVAIRDDGGLATALVRMEESERMRGLVVMVQDDEEIVLVNLIGAIKPETLAFAMNELGLELPATTVHLPGDCAASPALGEERPCRAAAAF